VVYNQRFFRRSVPKTLVKMPLFKKKLMDLCLGKEQFIKNALVLIIQVVDEIGKRIEDIRVILWVHFYLIL